MDFKLSFDINGKMPSKEVMDIVDAMYKLGWIGYFVDNGNIIFEKGGTK